MSPSPTRARQRLLPRKPRGSPQDDVSRLLHPSYATPPSPSSCSSERERRRASLPAAAYVDAAGEMHDPDFHAFPLALSIPGAIGRDPRAPQHQRRVPSAATARTRDLRDLDDLDARSERWRRHSADYATAYAHRPSWEYYGAGGYGGAPRASTYDAPLAPLDIPDDGWTFRSTLRESPGSGSSDERPLARASYASYAYGEPDDDDATLSSVARVVRRATGRRRLQKARAVVDLGEDEDEDAYPYAPPHYYDEPEPMAEPKQEHAARREHASRDDDDVPTCTHTLRLKYHALSLRIRFGIFRAQRRIKRRLHKPPPASGLG